MKFVNVILMCFILLATSCNRDEEPPREFALNIVEQYLPATIVVNKSDKELLEEVKAYNRMQVVVNSADELPDDPIGFHDFFRNISFDNYTLFLLYSTHPWVFQTYRNYYYIDNGDHTYHWQVQIGCTDTDGEEDFIRFSRFAILVRKLPKDASVIMGVSWGSLDWDWSEYPPMKHLSVNI